MSCGPCWQLAKLIMGVHYVAKYERKSSHFDLITDINLLLCCIGGIQGIFTIQ